MESEALRNIRTMRQVKSSLEVARNQRVKTTNSLAKTTEEIRRLASIDICNSQTVQILAKEKTRANKFEASAEISRQKLLKSREKIASLINRNRALTRLRHEIQQDRDQKKESPSLSKQLVTKREISKRGGLRGIELKY
jgi:hypothetical protein